MKIRTQGGLCQLDYNRKLKIFLDVSNNRRAIQNFIHELAFKLAKRETFSGKEHAVLEYMNEPTRNVVLTFKKDGRLVFDTTDSNGESLRKIEKLDNVHELLFALCGGEGNFKASLEKVLVHFKEISDRKKSK